MNGRGNRDGAERRAIRRAPLQLPYRLRWRPGGVLIGAHPALGEADGGEFRRHVPLLRRPDPRRIDLRATFRDPLGELHVRQFAPRSAVSVIAIVDLSGSMGFEATVRRMQVVAELCATLTASAYRMGDRFGLIGCDAGIRYDVFIPPTRRQGLELEVYDRLDGAEPRGPSVRGILVAADLLPARRSLVFVISDFQMPIAQVSVVLDALWRHDVVPVVVRDRGEEDDLPSWGLVELEDLETGKRRLAFMRPALREKWRRGGRARRTAIDKLFQGRGRAAFHLVDRLDTDALAEYLMAG